MYWHIHHATQTVFYNTTPARMSLTATDTLPAPRKSACGTRWWTISDRLRTSGRYERLVVVEDQFPTNGLYSSVCRGVAEHGLGGQVQSISPTDYTFKTGVSSDYYTEKYSLDLEGIASLLKKL